VKLSHQISDPLREILGRLAPGGEFPSDGRLDLLDDLPFSR
jgi:hypothetical protein